MESVRCGVCGGSGIDPKRAATPLVMPGWEVYVAALAPCPECKGLGRVIPFREQIALKVAMNEAGFSQADIRDELARQHRAAGAV